MATGIGVDHVEETIVAIDQQTVGHAGLSSDKTVIRGRAGDIASQALGRRNPLQRGVNYIPQQHCAGTQPGHRSPLCPVDQLTACHPRGQTGIECCLLSGGHIGISQRNDTIGSGVVGLVSSAIIGRSDGAVSSPDSRQQATSSRAQRIGLDGAAPIRGIVQSLVVTGFGSQAGGTGGTGTTRARLGTDLIQRLG